MLHQIKNLDMGSKIVMSITVVLFTVALFVKGLTHDLLLEAAVFLVSLKLIILTYRISESVKKIQDRLDLIFNEEIHLEKLVTALQQPKKVE